MDEWEGNSFSNLRVFKSTLGTSIGYSKRVLPSRSCWDRHKGDEIKISKKEIRGKSLEFLFKVEPH
jgi:hypothetical protein